MFHFQPLKTKNTTLPEAREVQPKGASKAIDGLLDEMEDDDGGSGAMGR